MRLVQVTVPTGKREAVLSTLDDRGIDYVVTDETSGREFTALVYFPLPTDAVEEVLDALQNEASLGENAYTVVTEAEAVVSRRFEQLEERYQEKGGETSPERVARQELRKRADDQVPDLATFLVLTVVSVVVATAGVLLDDAAIVVGSMVIAPLVGPAMATSVGTVIADRELFVRGVTFQALGAVVAVVAAVAFASTAKAAFLVQPGLDPVALDQVAGRAAPGVLALVVALGAGVAGALSLSGAVSTSLVGVAIAVALVPPVGVVGVAVAWGRPGLAAGALVLLVVNFLSINAAAMGTLWYGGYRPGRLFRFEEARSATVRRITTLLVAIAVLSVFLGAVTYSSYLSASFEQQAQTAVDATMSEEPYTDLEALQVSVRYDQNVPFRRPDAVVVTVARPEDGAYPGLADAIADRLREATGSDVTVRVRFVEVSGTG